MKKLSPAQVKVLRALAEPGNLAYFLSGLDAYWFVRIGTGHRIRFETMERLIVAGFLGIEKDRWDRYKTAYILPAGRDYLKTLEAPE